MKKVCAFSAFYPLVIIMLILFSGCKAEKHSEYIRAATYFSDQWPMTLWNGEMKKLDADLQQIKSDGFNAIVLLVPWKEFQPSIDPILYNQYAIKKLDEVIEAAKANSLSIFLRLGYVWDFVNDEKEWAAQRFIDIINNSKMFDAWLDFSKLIYTNCSKHENYKGAFITWEDFWPVLDLCYHTDPSIRRTLAKDVGFQDWVEEMYGIDKYNEIYGTLFLSSEEVLLPNKNEISMNSMYEFYDDLLNRVLAETQKVCPNLSMEVRIEKDRVNESEGNTIYRYSHESTYQCGESDFVSLMYRIPIGFKYDGRELTSQEALAKTEEVLRNFTAELEGKTVFIDQFLFFDNTPGHGDAPYLDSELNTYLENVDNILSKYSMGFAVWTYQDYKANMLYNSQFAIGNDGWIVKGSPDFREYEKADVCVLKEGDALAQIIPLYRNAFDSDTYNLELDIVECSNDIQLEISMGAETIVLNKDDIYPGKTSFQFDKNESFDLSIEVQKGSIIIDDMWFYGYIQEGRIYNQNGEQQDCIESLRVLNSKLSE